MRIGFIGLGNVGGKLAGSLLRNGYDLTVRDLDRDVARPFLDAGARWGESPARMIEAVDAVITCLPAPVASAPNPVRPVYFRRPGADGALGAAARHPPGVMSIGALPLCLQT